MCQSLPDFVACICFHRDIGQLIFLIRKRIQTDEIDGIFSSPAARRLRCHKDVDIGLLAVS